MHSAQSNMYLKVRKTKKKKDRLITRRDLDQKFQIKIITYLQVIIESRK